MCGECLFLAALERGFERVADAFRAAAADYREGRAPQECEDALHAMGLSYADLLHGPIAVVDARTPAIVVAADTGPTLDGTVDLARFSLQCNGFSGNS